MSAPAGWDVVIGLEIHAQLATRSKIFSGAATAYGADPNTQACLVDLGYPGVLPVLNAEAVRMAVKFGLAVGASIAPRSIFARKNYFYPDLPKGYQISQYELPIVHDGTLAIPLADGGTRTVRIIRAHLEEDAGKSLHENFAGQTGIDLNRAGTPLVEIVSAPDLRAPAEAVAYMKKIHQLVRYLGICDGNMQEGSFRCDANVSVRRTGTDKLGTRTETKNLNSFRFLEAAIEFEIERQVELLESGGTVVQETRLYDPDRGETRPMRSKEEANDYRYFPDPDLLPVVLEPAFVEQVRATLPPLPDQVRERFVAAGIKLEDALVLTEDPDVAGLTDALIAATGQPQAAANFIRIEAFALMNKAGVGVAGINRTVAAELIKRSAASEISKASAKALFEEFGAAADAPAMADIIAARSLGQISDTGAIEKIVDEVLAASATQVAQYRAGETKVMGFLVGQVMKKSAGKANPAQVNELLKKKLGS